MIHRHQVAPLLTRETTPSAKDGRNRYGEQCWRVRRFGDIKLNHPDFLDEFHIFPNSVEKKFNQGPNTKFSSLTLDARKTLEILELTSMANQYMDEKCKVVPMPDSGVTETGQMVHSCHFCTKRDGVTLETTFF